MSRGTTYARRAVPRLEWGLWALTVTLTVLGLLLLVLDRSHPGVHVYDDWLENTLGALLFSTVGWPLCLLGLASLWLRRPEDSR